MAGSLLLAPSVPRRRISWAVVLLAAVLPTSILAAASCQSPSPGLGAVRGASLEEGAGQGGDCVGPTCEDPCEDPKPGCPCDVEGQHLLCGEVVNSLDDGQTLHAGSLAVKVIV